MCGAVCVATPRPAVGKLMPETASAITRDAMRVDGGEVVGVQPVFDAEHQDHERQPEKVARQAGVHTKYFCSLFHTLTQQSPRQ